MSAERTSSRARQFLFRKAFERFPFGRCERRLRACNASSYDVRTDGAQDMQGRWTALDASGIGAESPNIPQEKMDSSPTECLGPRTQSLSEPVKTSSPLYLNSEPVPSSVVLGNGLGFDPFPHLQLENQTNGVSGPSGNYGHCNRVASHASSSASVSQTVASPRHAPLSSSASVSSMETDAHVDPETGERAFG